MNKPITTIKNPLTVIGIFAGLAEIAGTAVLPFVAEANQTTYIWFLMLFPVFLVTLFFATLNFNPKVLYAPSDFADENNYMDLFRPSSTSEKIRKMVSEMLEQDGESPAVTDVGGTQPSPEQEIISSKSQLLSFMERDPRSRYIVAENLVIDRLATEFRTAPKRDISFRNRYGNLLIDGVFEDKNGLVLVEIKFFSERSQPKMIRPTLHRLRKAYFALPEETKKNVRFLLAIAYDMPLEMANQIEHEITGMFSDFSMPIDLRMYDIHKLIENAEAKTNDAFD